MLPPPAFTNFTGSAQQIPAVEVPGLGRAIFQLQQSGSPHLDTEQGNAAAPRAPPHLIVDLSKAEPAIDCSIMSAGAVAAAVGSAVSAAHFSQLPTGTRTAAGMYGTNLRLTIPPSRLAIAAIRSAARAQIITVDIGGRQVSYPIRVGVAPHAPPGTAVVHIKGLQPDYCCVGVVGTILQHCGCGQAEVFHEASAQLSAGDIQLSRSGEVVAYVDLHNSTLSSLPSAILLGSAVVRIEVRGEGAAAWTAQRNAARCTQAPTRAWHARAQASNPTGINTHAGRSGASNHQQQQQQQEQQRHGQHQWQTPRWHRTNTQNQHPSTARQSTQQAQPSPARPTIHILRRESLPTNMDIDNPFHLLGSLPQSPRPQAQHTSEISQPIAMDVDTIISQAERVTQQPKAGDALAAATAAASRALTSLPSPSRSLVGSLVRGLPLRPGGLASPLSTACTGGRKPKDKRGIGADTAARDSRGTATHNVTAAKAAAAPAPADSSPAQHSPPQSLINSYASRPLAEAQDLVKRASTDFSLGISMLEAFCDGEHDGDYSIQQAIQSFYSGHEGIPPRSVTAACAIAAQLCQHGYRAKGGTCLVPALKVQRLLNALLSIPGWADIDGTGGKEELLRGSTQTALRRIAGANCSPPQSPQRKSKRLATKAKQAPSMPFWEVTSSTKRQRSNLSRSRSASPERPQPPPSTSEIIHQIIEKQRGRSPEEDSHIRRNRRRSQSPITRSIVAATPKSRGGKPQ